MIKKAEAGMILLLLIGLLPFELSGQSMAIRKMELVSDKLVVHYEIEDANLNNEYRVSLYSSNDNFSTPLTKVSGDIGPEVKPGRNKVLWDIREEYKNFKGPISVEVRANVFVPFVRLKTFTSKRGYKRGKTYPLEWRPGNTNPVHIELFRGAQRLQGELNHPNSGTYTVNFSKSTRPGRNYRIKITDARHADDFLYSENFKIRRKLPLLIKILPLAGAGFLASQLLKADEDTNDLPDFPATPQ